MAKRTGHMEEPSSSGTSLSPGRFLALGSTKILFLLLAFLFPVFLYINTLNHGFVWDDKKMIVENENIARLDGKILRRVFLEDYWRNDRELRGHYRPLVVLSLHLDRKFLGDEPSSFHFTNMIAHGLASAMVYLFLLFLLADPLSALAASLLFAAHPVHTENVAWIAGRGEMIASFWIFATMTFYALARKESSQSMLRLSLLSFLLALLAHESALVTPLLVAAVELLYFSSRRGKGMSDRLSPLPYFAVLVLYLLLRHNIMENAQPPAGQTPPGDVSALALPLSLIAASLGKLLLPLSLSTEYTGPLPKSLFNPWALAGLAAAGGLIYSALRLHRSPLYSLGALWLVVGLLPAMRFSPTWDLGAERSLYLPSLGLILIVVQLLRSLSWSRKGPNLGSGGARSSTEPHGEREHSGAVKAGGTGKGKPRTAGAAPRVGFFLFLLILAYYSTQSLTRNLDWKNEQVLARRTAAESPSSPRARLRLGDVYLAEGKLSEAETEYKEAIRLWPDYAQALNNLAGIYKKTDRREEAVELLTRAVEADPTNADFHNNLGTILVALNRDEEARDHFLSALSLDHDNLRARFNLGLVSLMLNEYKTALRNFEWVKDRGDSFVMAYYYLGYVHMQLKDPEAAAKNLRAFLDSYKKDDRFRTNAKALLAEIEKAYKEQGLDLQQQQQ